MQLKELGGKHPMNAVDDQIVTVIGEPAGRGFAGITRKIDRRIGHLGMLGM